MKLHIQEQVFYTLPNLAASTPAGPVVVAVDRWEASFDGGATWHASQAHPDLPTAPAWLIRGANYPGPDDTGTASGILIAQKTVPLIRLRDTPETTIEKAEVIRPWTQLAV